MANQAEKRRFEANRKRLRVILLSILTANVWYIFWRIIIRQSSASWFNYCTLAIANVVYFFSYAILSKAARPVFSATNEIVSGGSDLSMGGFLEYVHDAIILMAILQFLGAMTDWAWWLILVVPGYGGYHAWKYYQQFKSMQQIEEPEQNPKRSGKKPHTTYRTRR